MGVDSGSGVAVRTGVGSGDRAESSDATVSGCTVSKFAEAGSVSFSTGEGDGVAAATIWVFPEFLARELLEANR
jgi:hypothetical protein